MLATIDATVSWKRQTVREFQRKIITLNGQANQNVPTDDSHIIKNSQHRTWDSLRALYFQIRDLHRGRAMSMTTDTYAMTQNKRDLSDLVEMWKNHFFLLRYLRNATGAMPAPLTARQPPNYVLFTSATLANCGPFECRVFDMQKKVTVETLARIASWRFVHNLLCIFRTDGIHISLDSTMARTVYVPNHLSDRFIPDTHIFSRLVYVFEL